MKYIDRMPRLYVLLFCAAFALFGCVFYAQARIEQSLVILEKLALKKGVTFEGKNFSWLPLRLKMKKIIFAGNGRALELADAALSPGFFPLRLELAGNILGGRFEVAIFLKSIFAPTIYSLEMRGADLTLAGMLVQVAAIEPYVQVTAGKVACHGRFAFSWKDGEINWDAFKGTGGMELTGGAFRQKVQALREDSLEPVTGTLQLDFDGAVCVVRQCALRSGDISLQASGRVQRWYEPAASSLNLDTSLHVPPNLLEEDFVPKRTLAQLKKNGTVAAHISQSLLKPRVRLEE